MSTRPVSSTDALWWRGAALACPIDRTSLKASLRSLQCLRCRRTFPVECGIPHLFGEPASSPRWRRAQHYELDFWNREHPLRRKGRADQNRQGALGLARLLDGRTGSAWRRRALQIGPADQGEIHYLPVAERFAVEPLAAELARRDLLQPGVHWIAGQGERLPFPDGHFSLVLITNVLDHVADPIGVLAEMQRCLSPDGVVWLTCHVSPALVLPPFRILHRLGWGYFAGHPWCFTAGMLDGLCRSAGFGALLAETRAHEPGELGCGGSWRRRLKPLLLRNRQLLLAPLRQPDRAAV